MIARHPLIAFVLAVLVPVHGILWTALALGADPVSLQPLKLPFAFLPSAAAFWLTWRLDGEEGVASLVGRTFVSGQPVRRYAYATGAFLALGALALALRGLVDGHVPPEGSFAAWTQVLAISPVLLLLPGIAEEYGWRGFLQARLESLEGSSLATPFVASLIVGLTWGSWHTMDSLMGNWTGGPFFVSVFFAYIVGSSVIIGALFGRAGGAIAVAMLGHFSANAASQFLPIWTSDAGMRTPLMFVGLIWIVALAIGARDLSRAVATTPAADDEAAVRRG